MAMKKSGISGAQITTRTLLRLCGAFECNLLAALYLGYLKITGGFASTLLWPTCALYAVIALLMAGLACESGLTQRRIEKVSNSLELKQTRSYLMGA
jgi:hypothetical protein